MKSLLAGSITFTAAGMAGLLLLLSSPAAALTFNQNRIMDDVVFDNTSRMSAAQIDTFLNQFPSSCISTNNHFLSRDPTGYSPTTGFTYGSNVSAGHVIYDAGLAYGLNPQVILATLQKEQSLVTGGSGCSVLQYTGAMGYGCPDSGTTHNYSGLNLYTLNGTTVTSVNGTCVNSAAKAGFSQQVIHAAWLLRFGEQRSKGNISWDVQADNYPVAGDHWDNSDDPLSCYAGSMTQGTWQVCPSGGSTYYDGYFTIDSTSVHIDTGATAALYWYTPHFSGNQNFVTIFTNWFGSTTVAGYAWSTGGYLITSLDGATKFDPGQLQPGQTYLVSLEAKNEGSATWTNGGPTPVTLGAVGDTSSQFCNATWVACNRPAYLQEPSIAPGQTGHFVFRVQVPYKPGHYWERFKPVAEFFTWFNDYSPYDTFGIWVVSPGSFTWSMSIYKIYDQSGTTQLDPGKLQTNQTYLATVAATNTGTATWLNSGPIPVTLAASNPTSRTSILCANTWEACNRPAILTEPSVAPGQTGHFSFLFKTPATPGVYRESFKPVAEFYAWFNDEDPNDVFGIIVN